MSDTELAMSARDGDRNAFRQLVERHYDSAYRVALRMTGSTADAEDIAQDICVALADKLGSFRGTSSFSTWLYRVVVNACKDHHRRRATSDRLHSDYAMVYEFSRADAADDKQRRGWLGEAIAGLEPGLRETAVLVLSEDLSHSQAGEVLGCAESTISWRMHEIRKKLKTLMDANHV